MVIIYSTMTSNGELFLLFSESNSESAEEEEGTTPKKHGELLISTVHNENQN